MRKKIFDPLRKCLLYLDCEANKKFWDAKWEETAKHTFTNPPRHGLTIRITGRYLSPGTRILEGGCGLGDIVYALDKAGYNVDGIDYAPKVVQSINSNWPHLNVYEGDVRNIDCDDGFYDGYWSFGVIEHFVDGYEDIAIEMHRVIRPGGYLFLSFPAFNPFRQAFAKAGKYPQFTEDIEVLSEFFQYALNPMDVKIYFEHLGFELIENRGTCSLQGLAEDLSIVAAVQEILRIFPQRVETVFSMIMDIIVGRYAGHSSLLILRKRW